jgi:hypothetical protein
MYRYEKELFECHVISYNVNYDEKCEYTIRVMSRCKLKKGRSKQYNGQENKR